MHALVRVTIAALMLVATHTGGARAATRSCGVAIASAGEDKQSELAAKQKAMAGWLVRAKAMGPAYAAWRNAADKSLSCLRLREGIWRCQAYGRPCGVSQVPGAQPRGTPPVPQQIAPQPKAKGIQA